jgi:hypothetical protein
MLHEHDVVVLKKELPGIAVPVFSEGTIVHVHDVGAQSSSSMRTVRRLISSTSSAMTTSN